MSSPPFHAYYVPLTLSAHARDRAAERCAPACVLEALSRGLGSDLVGRHAHHGRTTLRIVRTLFRYWIAPHWNGVVGTLYAVEREDIVAWGITHLLNPTETIGRLRRMPVHVTPPDEAVTAELAGLWLDDATATA